MKKWVAIGVMFTLSACSKSAIVAGGAAAEDEGAKTTALAAFESAEAAMDATGGVFEGGAGLDVGRVRGNLGGLFAVEDVLDDGGHCNLDLAGIGQGEDEKVADFLACLMVHNDKSPETVKGGMHLVKEVLSGIESQIDGFQYAEEVTMHENLSFVVDVEDEDGMSVTVNVAEKAITGDVWEKRIDVCLLSADGQSMQTQEVCEQQGYFFSVWLKDSEGKLGFKTVNRMNYPDIETSIYMADSGAQEIRYETISTKNGNHTRILISGTVSEEFELDSVDAVSLATAIANTDGESDDDATLSNIRGMRGHFDGTSLCISASQGSDNQSLIPYQFGLGECGEFPVYDSTFHAFHSNRAATAGADSDESYWLDGYTHNDFGMDVFLDLAI